jgi:chemotaxis signal transduction protein
MSAIADFPSLLLSSAELDQRFVLIQVGSIKLIVPAQAVAETLIIERSRLLTIPFYSSAVLGCFHHLGQIVPLFSTHQLLGFSGSMTTERLIVLRLSQQVGHCAGVGLVIDKVLGTKTKEQLEPEFLSVLQASSLNSEIQLFRSEMLPDTLFLPQR